jgi:geranylgeranyl diphosphate synthase type I
MVMTTPSPSLLPGAAQLSVAATERELRRCFNYERARWNDLDPALGAFLDRVGTFVLTGGKRLRPVMVHAGVVACGGDGYDTDVARVGAAVELLHGFALLHDDVMDGSDQRRGRPSFHRAVAADHQGHGGRGEARRYGEGMAVLAGDLVHVYADRLMASMDATVRQVWVELRVEVTMGQHLDLDGAARGDRDVGRADLVAELKTARYTVERPLHLGAALAGRLDDAGPHLSAYGRPIGLAFQQRDDLLGALGDSERTGKPVGDDLREGKPTRLLAVAHRQATPAQARVLARVGDPALTSAEVATIQEVLHASGAVSSIEATIRDLRQAALHALDGAPLEPAGTRLLVELADRLTERTA